MSVFLIHFDPKGTGVDDRLWVVVGDLPPGYIVMDEASSSRDALLRYIEQMELWVAAVESGDSVDDLIPVYDSTGNMPLAATSENAVLLGRRLEILRSYASDESSSA